MRKFILPIILLVIASGCTENRPIQVDTSNGVIINSFIADPVTAEDGDSVLFTIDLENVGGTTASDVKVVLNGIEGVWRRTSTALSGDATESDATLITDKTLKPPYSPENRPGDYIIKTKAFYTPPVPEGINVGFPVTARVEFDYSSTGTISLPAISESLYRAKIKAGETFDSTIPVQNTNAPIQIGLVKGMAPAIIDSTGTGDQEVSFVFDLTNTGDGFPLSGEDVGKIEGTLSVAGVGATFKDCAGLTSGKGPYEIPEASLDLLKLRSDGRVPVACTLSIDKTKWESATSGNINLILDLSYRYFVESTQTVNVIGR